MTVEPTALPVTEGADEPYTVVLTSQPTANVAVSVTVPGATDVSASPTALTFTASDWATAQTVTVSAGQDDDAEDDEATLTHAVSGGDYGSEMADSVTVTVNDDETASTAVALAVDPAMVAEDVGAEGQAVEVSATLNAAPFTAASEVTVTVAGGTATVTTDFEAVSGFTLTIDPGQTSGTGTFTLKPVNDAVSEGDETVTVSGSATDLTVSAATLTIGDDEAAPTVTLALSAAAISENGGSTAVTASLDHESSAETTVTVSLAPVSPATSGDYTLSSNRMLTIAAGTTASTGEVTITAVDNAVDAAHKAVTVSATARNTVGVTAPADKTLTLSDDDERGVTVAPTALPVPEGEEKPYTVVLASEPTAEVEVSVTVPGATDVSASPTALTFTSTNWDDQQTVTVSAAEDDDAVTDEAVTLSHAVTSSGDYGSETASVTVSITEDDTAAAALTLVFAAPAHGDEDSSGDVNRGDVLTYTATATNSGNVPLANVTVKDLLVNADGESCATLALEESCELSGDYTVTQANVDAGQVVNTATATADDLSDQTVTRTTTVAQTKKLTLAKTTTATSFDKVDDKISYSYQVTNSGTVTLSGTLAIADDKIASGDITCGAVPSGGLGPGASVSCTATYTVVQADVDAGKVVNEATATLDGVTSSGGDGDGAVGGGAGDAAGAVGGRGQRLGAGGGGAVRGDFERGEPADGVGGVCEQ